MESHQITGLLQAAGWQHKRIAKAYNCRPEFVGKVISGEQMSSGLRGFIAGILAEAHDKTYMEVWPNA